MNGDYRLTFPAIKKIFSGNELKSINYLITALFLTNCLIIPHKECAVAVGDRGFLRNIFC